MAIDRTEHHSLTDIFGEETVLVNIAKETSTGTIGQRIKQWCAQSDRNVYIGRGSPWGNPYSHKGYGEIQVATREEAIEKYRAYILSRPDLIERLKELTGKRLGCWCVQNNLSESYVCHGQVLLELLWSVK